MLKSSSRVPFNNAKKKKPHSIFFAALFAATFVSPAHAETELDVVTELRRELEVLKAQQTESNKRIADLEVALVKVAAAPQAQSQAVALATNASGGSLATKVSAPSRLAISGDIRMRYESNFSDNDASDRNRAVFRARLRAAFAVNDWLTIGAQLATGDLDDPNSTDVTIDDFDDKLAVSLDQIYARSRFGNFQIDVGRIPQPFTRTELVWDGDVSPQGVAASYSHTLGSNGSKIKASGLYFPIDEVVAGPDSDMIGGQVGLELPVNPRLKFELAAGYYDYSLRSVDGADAGDFRTNLFQNGRYLSDFNLLDVIAAVNWQGLGEKWPVRIVGDYVKNYGAANAEDSGFGVDVILGRASKAHDWRFSYGYAQTESDAVLAAFSQDNTTIGTNYKQHSLAVDYTVSPQLIFNATFYHYRPDNALYAGTNDPTDWLNRFRLNALFQF